jgi:hypothetical protein
VIPSKGDPYPKTPPSYIPNKNGSDVTPNQVKTVKSQPINDIGDSSPSLVRPYIPICKSNYPILHKEIIRSGLFK